MIKRSHLFIICKSSNSWAFRNMISLTVQVILVIYVRNRLEEFWAFTPMNVFWTNYSCRIKLLILLFLSCMIIEHSTCHCCMYRLFERRRVISINLTFCLVWHNRLLNFAIVLLITGLCCYFPRKICVFWGLLGKLVLRLWGRYFCKLVDLTGWTRALHHYAVRLLSERIGELRLRFRCVFIQLIHCIGGSWWRHAIEHLFRLLWSCISNRIIELLLGWQSMLIELCTAHIFCSSLLSLFKLFYSFL